VDEHENVYLCGFTKSRDFPLVNPIQTEFGGAQDVFIMKLDPWGNITYSTIWGTSGFSEANALFVDNEQNVYVTGRKLWGECFVLKLNASGAHEFTFNIGGSTTEGKAIVVDTNGSIYVTGTTNSPSFPSINDISESPIAYNGNSDCFVFKLAPNGRDLEFSFHIGGYDSEAGTDITIGKEGILFVTGWTFAEDFPVWNSPMTGFYAPPEIAHSGSFVFGLTPNGSDLVFSSYFGGNKLSPWGIAHLNDSTFCVSGESTFNGIIPDAMIFGTNNDNSHKNGFVCKISYDSDAPLLSSIPSFDLDPDSPTATITTTYDYSPVTTRQLTPIWISATDAVLLIGIVGEVAIIIVFIRSKQQGG
jgi:hypothetical protein